MSPKKPAPETPEPLRFEEALARLEAIVQELEGKDLSLEDTLARYEEGSRLVRECAQRLDEAEQTDPNPFRGGGVEDRERG